MAATVPVAAPQTGTEVVSEARKVIQEIVRKLVAGYAPQKVILFGSHARGTATG